MRSCPPAAHGRGRPPNTPLTWGGSARPSSGQPQTHLQLPTPNGPNTAWDDLRKRALEFYAKAKAIRHNKPMGAATQPTQSA
jgi:hypothetical protein